MAYELREGQGSLFRNTYKRQGEKTPDWKGDFLLNGIAYEIAGWERQAQNGGTYYSLKVQPKQERQAAQVYAPRPQASAPQYAPAPRYQPESLEPQDEDLPF